MVSFSLSEFKRQEPPASEEEGVVVQQSSRLESEQGPGTPELTMDSLNTHKGWIDSAHKIYQHEQGEEFDPDKAGYNNIADWFKKRHADLGNSIYNMGSTYTDALTDIDMSDIPFSSGKGGEMSDDVKRAWADSIGIFQKTDWTVDSFLRGAGSFLADPFTWGTAGFGIALKALGGGGAKLVGAAVLRNALLKQLQGKAVSKEALESALRGRATKEISKGTIQEATKQAAKVQSRKNYAKLTAAGAGWGALESVPRQLLHEDVGVEGAEGVSFRDTAESIGAGAVVGPALGLAVKGIGKGLRRLRGESQLDDITEDVAEEVIEEGTTGKVVDEDVDITDLQSFGYGAEPVAGKRVINETIDEAGLPKVIPNVVDSANHKYKKVGSDEIVKGAPRERGRVTEFLAKINTGAGRLLSSTAALPRTLANASIKRERHERGMIIEVKKAIKDIDRAAKKERITDDMINRYINDGDHSAILGTKTLTAIDNAKLMIDGNEAKLNNLLNLPEGKGLGFNRRDGETYLTRTFEASNNPVYLKRMQQALKGQKVDGAFLAKVENGRDFFKGYTNPDGSQKFSSDEIDGMIEHLVANLAKPKETEVILSMTGILDNLVAQSRTGTASAAILRKRKDLNKTILNILGEKESGVQKISETLTRQNQLINHLEYVSQVNEFAKAALRQVGDVGTVKLGGFVNFLPKQEAKIVKGRPGAKTGGLGAGHNLFELTEKAAGTFAKSSTMLKDVYTSPQFGKYIERGIDYWTTDKAGGSFVGNLFGHMAALGQATQTILDVPAYFINTYGAFQSLVSNGYVLHLGAGRAARKGLVDLFQQISLRKPEALERLRKLKEQGVIDSDLSSEMIIKNINLYGKDPTRPFSKWYRGSMSFLSRAYGTPDSYAKLIAHEIEFNTLKKIFRHQKPVNKKNLKAWEDELFELASERVRNVIPSYSVAAPAARQLSHYPVGTYALFPAEMVRTTKNTAKLALKDIRDGLLKNEDGRRNVRQVWHGLKRLTGLGTTVAGVGMYIQNNNEQAGIDNTHVRLIDMVSQPWAKGNNRIHLEGMMEQPDGSIGTRFINSTSVDAQDYLKVPVRLFTGRVLAGEEVSDFEVDEAWKAMQNSAIGPYTNPKFLTDAIINVVANTQTGREGKLYSEQYPGLSAENVKRFVLEIASAFEPGTYQAIDKYLESTAARDLLTSKGLEDQEASASGWPLRRKDILNWLRTGVRTTTMNFDKSLGYTLSKNIKMIEGTNKEFINYIRQLEQQEFTPTIAQDIVTKYRELQELKRRNFSKLAQTAGLASDMTYYGQDDKGKMKPLKYGYARVLRAATDNFFYKSDPELMRGIAASTMEGARVGMFQPDRFTGDARFRKIIMDKFKDINPLNILSLLANAEVEEMQVPVTGSLPSIQEGLSYRP